MTCLIGLSISIPCLTLGCNVKPVQVPLTAEEPAVAEFTDASSPDPAPTNQKPTRATEAVPEESGTQHAVSDDPAAVSETAVTTAATAAAEKVEVATFGAGCFWCTEAVFLRLEGVTAVESGYAGGFVKNPTYEAVCSGETGHAEVCRITYQSDKISFDDLLKVFWMTHDPTTLNQQGADRGTQYRSVVFYHDAAQKELAENYKRELDKSGAFSRPIVTEISPIADYYKAEAYHQNYFELNPFQGYCQAVVGPKVAKFEKVFKDKLKAKP